MAFSLGFFRVKYQNCDINFWESAWVAGKNCWANFKQDHEGDEIGNV